MVLQHRSARPIVQKVIVTVQASKQARTRKVCLVVVKHVLKLPSRDCKKFLCSHCPFAGVTYVQYIYDNWVKGVRITFGSVTDMELLSKEDF